MATKKRKFAATLPDAAALEQFTSGADKRIELVAPVARSAPPKTAPVPKVKPAVKEDTMEARTAKPTNGINLRLNDFQLDLVRRVAALDDRSIQRTLKRILIPALEARLKG